MGATSLCGHRQALIMNLHRLLEVRQQQGDNLRVGLIGAEKFGSLYLAQIPRTSDHSVWAMLLRWLAHPI